jgi:hypothetical protein
MDDCIDDPANRSIKGHLEEPAPPRVNASDERLDHAGLDVVAKGRPRPGLCPHAQAAAQRGGHGSENVDARLGEARLDPGQQDGLMPAARARRAWLTPASSRWARRSEPMARIVSRAVLRALIAIFVWRSCMTSPVAGGGACHSTTSGSAAAYSRRTRARRAICARGATPRDRTKRKGAGRDRNDPLDARALHPMHGADMWPATSVPVACLGLGTLHGVHGRSEGQRAASSRPKLPAEIRPLRTSGRKWGDGLYSGSRGHDRPASASGAPIDAR